jgi:nitrogen fixation protein NifB
VTPAQALRQVRKAVKSPVPIKVVGVCGPGDSLANRQTFDFLNLVQKDFPQLIKCISTNGLLLPEKIDQLVNSGVNAISVTINAIEPHIAALIHGWIHLAGEVYEDEEGAAILIQNQLQGIAMAAANGIAVKVNTVLIPGINNHHIDHVAVKVKRLGAAMMNIIPLVPRAEFAELRPPSTLQVEQARKRSAPIIGQMSNCQQCVL